LASVVHQNRNRPKPFCGSPKCGLQARMVCYIDCHSMMFGRAWQLGS
jgi:hypothetical protein